MTYDEAKNWISRLSRLATGRFHIQLTEEKLRIEVADIWNNPTELIAFAELLIEHWNHRMNG